MPVQPFPTAIPASKFADPAFLVLAVSRMQNILDQIDLTNAFPHLQDSEPVAQARRDISRSALMLALIAHSDDPQAAFDCVDRGRFSKIIRPGVERTKAYMVSFDTTRAQHSDQDLLTMDERRRVEAEAMEHLVTAALDITANNSSMFGNGGLHTTNHRNAVTFLSALRREPLMARNQLCTPSYAADLRNLPVVPSVRTAVRTMLAGSVGR